MPRFVSGAAGARAGLAELAQLASLLTGPGSSGGLIGSGYRAAMAGTGGGSATPVLAAAYDPNCATCHVGGGPPPSPSLPKIDVPESWKQLPPLLGDGRWVAPDDEVVPRQGMFSIARPS